MVELAQLAPDRPSTNPCQDLFGHAPFAKTLTKAILGYQSADGIVISLHGPWGAGKSTVLAYIQHDLDNMEEALRPVVVQFNPWWFSGQDNLAITFLGQLQAVLPAKYHRFKVLAKKLSEFSDAIGGAADVASGAMGIPVGGKIIEAGIKLLSTSPKNIPEIKQSLSDLLLKERKRVLIIIDDIDRLTPDEVGQLFAVIKALADFPYVTYLLAFDREVIANAINYQTGLPGDRYLEKIIQVPFELPQPDRLALRRALSLRLDAIIGSTLKSEFDISHWNNVFLSGIEPLIKVPRDVMRLANALSVTYPAIANEVNPVDFIAMECLRLFLPTAYIAIRDNPDFFTGLHYIGIGGDRDKETERLYHEKWLELVPVDLRESTKNMLRRLFPRLDAVWLNSYYDATIIGKWRRDLKISAPEILPACFRLFVPQSSVSHADIQSLLAVQTSKSQFIENLQETLEIKQIDGASKIVALLERLGDHVKEDISAENAPCVIDALLESGDDLLINADDEMSMFGFGNERVIVDIMRSLLEKIESSQRLDFLVDCLKKAKALRCGQLLILILEEDAAMKSGNPPALFANQEIQSIKTAWCAGIARLAKSGELINHRLASWLIDAWREWGNSDEAVEWWQSYSQTNDGMLKLIRTHARQARTRSGNDLTWASHVHIDPRSLEPFTDINELATRIQLLFNAGEVSEEHASVTKAFLHSMRLINEGKDPNKY